MIRWGDTLGCILTTFEHITDHRACHPEEFHYFVPGDGRTRAHRVS